MSSRHRRQHRSRSRSRSKSRSPKHHHKKDRSRQYYRRSRDKNRQDSPKNKKKHYSSSDSSSRKSSQSQRSNNQPQNKTKQQQISQQPRYKIQSTKTLKIQNCINKQAAQRALTDASINAGTSVPDQIQIKQGSIYAKYPSIQVSSLIKQLLKQKIQINGTQYRINFYPFKRIDLNMSYDWYCDKCDYKNFARRNKCYRCDNQKNINCKFDYSTSTITNVKINKQENINNCSLMIRGAVIMDIQQSDLLNIYQKYCSVKDIRMIKNKMTGQLKDFAFVQFFTPQDTAMALKQTSTPDFKIRGQKVSVMYSRNKSDDDYAKPLPYQKKQRKKDFGKKQKKDQPPVQSYYNRQRQLQIQQQKLRPIITIQQLKQKRQQQLRKKAATIGTRQLTQQQVKRRQAQLMAKQMQKQAKLQNTILYICVICRRKFKGQTQMKSHQINSQLHKFNKKQFELSI